MTLTVLAVPETPWLTTETNDPYIYGWREVARINEDGIRYFHRLPLSLEDILHPQEDDVRMHSYDHEKKCHYLSNVIQRQIQHDPTAVMLADVRVAWAKAGVKPHTPDISVVFGVKRVQNWSTFYEAIEGTRPQVVIEITSPSTRHLDLVDKFDEYERVGLAYYVLIDNYDEKGHWRPRLLGYELVANQYQSLRPNAQGWLWLEPLRLWLTVDEHGALSSYDEHGTLLLDYTEISAKLEAEMKARESAESRANEAETRAQELAARLRQLEAQLRSQ